MVDRSMVADDDIDDVGEFEVPAQDKEPLLPFATGPLDRCMGCGGFIASVFMVNAESRTARLLCETPHMKDADMAASYGGSIVNALLYVAAMKGELPPERVAEVMEVVMGERKGMN